VRAAPQLSVPLTVPQVLPSREQNAVLVSGEQPQTLPALQLWPPLQVPQLVTVRAAPQLSVPLTVPQFFPLRAQNATSVSATQALHWPLLPHVDGEVQLPQLWTVRCAPQLSTPLYEPHTRPTLLHTVASSSGVHDTGGWHTPLLQTPLGQLTSVEA
jgi:hypothetical protein